MKKTAHRSETARKTPRRKNRSARRQKRGLRFPEVAGKTLEFVELWLDDEESYIELRFPDQAALVFTVQPYAGINVNADYGRWKAGNWKRIGSSGDRVIGRSGNRA